MTRDYKNVTETHKKSRPKKKTPAPKNQNAIPGWMWLVSGVVIGGFVSFIVYLKLNVPINDQTHDVKVEKKHNVEKQPAKIVHKKPEENKPEKDKLEFYSILPNREVTIPEVEKPENKIKTNQEKSESAKRDAGIVKQAPKKNISYIYTLQVGSFLRFKDADKRKANLALLGIGSKIHAIKTNNKTHYRVLVGPYDDIKRINEIDAVMKSNNIRTLLLKERG